MSAKELTIFMPPSVDQMALQGILIRDLGLDPDVLTANMKPTLAMSAHRGRGAHYLLIEYETDFPALKQEMSEWAGLSPTYKRTLLACGPCLLVYYRDQTDARELFQVLVSGIGNLATQSVVENGFGCLLLLSDIFSKTTEDPGWSWEKGRFPEFPEVAESEWGQY